MNAPAGKFLIEDTWRGRVFGTEWRSAAGGSLDVVEPATGATITSVGNATAADVRKAAAEARAAQPGWAATPYEERAAILRLELRIGAGYQRSYDFRLIGLGAQHQRRLSRERRLEWDRRKDSANRRKHGAEATAVLDDPPSITISDPDQCRAP